MTIVVFNQSDVAIGLVYICRQVHREETHSLVYICNVGVLLLNND